MNAAIEQLIPHRAPMRFIGDLAGCTEKDAVATAHFNAGDFPLTGDGVLEAALVECVAQTVAAALGQRLRAKGQPDGAHAPGMLVAVSNFKIHARPAAGKSLRVEVRERKRLGMMVLISGKISCEGQTVAAGDLMVYA